MKKVGQIFFTSSIIVSTLTVQYCKTTSGTDKNSSSFKSFPNVKSMKRSEPGSWTVECLDKIVETRSDRELDENKVCQRFTMKVISEGGANFTEIDSRLRDTCSFPFGTELTLVSQPLIISRNILEFELVHFTPCSTSVPFKRGLASRYSVEVSSYPKIVGAYQSYPE